MAPEMATPAQGLALVSSVGYAGSGREYVIEKILITEIACKSATPGKTFISTLARAVRELERLEVIGKGHIEDSTKGKPQLVLWLQVAQRCGCGIAPRLGSMASRFRAQRRSPSTGTYTE